mgnify:CR=1 FL=1
MNRQPEEMNRDVQTETTDSESNLERLQHSEEQFRLLVEGVKDYAIYMLDPTGHIVSWNEGAERIKAGLTPEDQEQLTTQYAERAVSFIERHKARPFFLYVAHPMPHLPAVASPESPVSPESPEVARGAEVALEVAGPVAPVLVALAWVVASPE